MRRFIWVVLFGALIGGSLAAWFSPQMIGWYFDPPAEMGISCRPAVEWSILAYRKIILAGFAMGGILAMLLYFAIRSKIAERKLAAAGAGSANKN